MTEPVTPGQIDCARDAIAAMTGSAWGLAALLAGKCDENAAALGVTARGMAETNAILDALDANPTVDGLRAAYAAACRTILNVLENPQCA